MKRLQLIMLAVSLCLMLTLLVACGGGDTPVETTPDTTPQTEASTEDTTDAVVETQADTTIETQVETTLDTVAETVAETVAVTEAETTDPLAQKILAAEMALDDDYYIIADPNSDIDTQAQYDLLTNHTDLYVGKHFSIYGTAQVDAGVVSVTIGEAGLLPVVVSSDFPPMNGDIVILDVVLSATEGEDATTYTYTTESIELVERLAGPNNGQLMYVNVNTTLNVRTAPTTEGNTPIGVFQRADIVEVLDITGTWAKIVYPDAPDGVAYVSFNYLIDIQ